MATHSLLSLGEEPGNVALQQTPWRNRARLSSVADVAEGFLAAPDSIEALGWPSPWLTESPTGLRCPVRC
jgi:hypothetical protein